MRTGTRLAILLLVTYAAFCPAEERLPAAQPRPATTALEALEHYVEQHYPTLAEPDRGRAWRLFIGGGAAAAGSVALALIPAMQDWSPGGEEDTTLTFIGILGGLQGLAVNPFFGMGLGELLFPAVDLRGEYGSLLDLPAQEREQRARLVCRRIVERETRRGVAQILLTIGVTVGSVGAYYLGESLIGRTSAADDVGGIYALGLAGGALYMVLLLPGILLGSDVVQLRPWGGQ
jgi:hypothetical protein